MSLKKIKKKHKNNNEFLFIYFYQNWLLKKEDKGN